VDSGASEQPRLSARAQRLVGQVPRLRSPNASGDETLHSEDLESKATGWLWQFAIFAVGTLPAVGMIVLVSRRPGGTDA
jgi:hypothetical protein